MGDATGGGFENSSTIWQTLLTGIAMFVSFVGGAWSRGVQSGKTEGDVHARMSAISDRMTYLERRHDTVEDKLVKMDERLDEKMSRMAERIAVMPTRDEMSQLIARLESKLEQRR